MTPDMLARRLIHGAVFGLLIAAAFFLVFPRIDLTVSHLFGSTAGFPVAHDPFWIAVRYSFIATTDGTMLVLLLVLIRNLGRPVPSILDNPRIGFALLAYALGPGLVANGIFKPLWGRARPRNILEFGGHRLFSSPLLPSDQCQANCSFVSGEGSAVSAVALIALLLLWPHLQRSGRVRATLAAILYAGSGSALRIAFGGHFLSDVIFAALMMGIVIPSTYLAVSGSRDLTVLPDRVERDGAEG